jgi:N utilization substance protein A
MKGMRVQSIIRELRGEKIDIIEYSEDPVLFATHALSPAKISRVSIVDLTGKHMEVIVDDTQLSLAIGKRGQNVRLAAKLLGWKVDIKSEEEKRQEVESQMAALVAPGAPISILLDYGLPEHVLERLVSGGVATVERLGGMTPEELEDIPGIDAEVVERIRDAVVAYYGQYEEAGAPVEEGAFEQEPAADYGGEEAMEATAAEAAPVAANDTEAVAAENADGGVDDDEIRHADTEMAEQMEADAGAATSDVLPQELEDAESARLRNADVG